MPNLVGHVIWEHDGGFGMEGQVGSNFTLPHRWAGCPPGFNLPERLWGELNDSRQTRLLCIQPHQIGTNYWSFMCMWCSTDWGIHFLYTSNNMLQWQTIGSSSRWTWNAYAKTKRNLKETKVSFWRTEAVIILLNWFHARTSQGRHLTFLSSVEAPNRGISTNKECQKLLSSVSEP